jgi:L-threonylcarbamoyladenylate synthase
MQTFDENGGAAGPGLDPGKAQSLSFMMELDPDPLSSHPIHSATDLERAAGLLQDRRAIVYPTETLYGLLARAFDEDPLQMIIDLKDRPSGHPMPCIIGDEGDLVKLASSVTPDQKLLMNRFWPGPLTLIFDAIPGLPHRLTGGLGTIGVRVPGHDHARALAKMVGPLAATSANKSSEPTPNDPKAFTELFPGVPVFDGGILPPSKGSTILDGRSRPPKVIRRGDVPISALEKTLDTPIVRGEV